MSMTDCRLPGHSLHLVHPVFGTDRVALLRSEPGLTTCDDRTNAPLLALSQISLHDPRDETHMTLFYEGGRQGPGWTAYTWDIHRADLDFVRRVKAVE